MWSWIFADIPPYPFPHSFLLSRSKPVLGNFLSTFTTTRCVWNVLGALIEHTYDDSMYKECQKENCYQVFLFLRVSLFLLILSIYSVMYDFIFFLPRGSSWIRSIPKKDSTWFETFSVNTSQKNYVINVSIVSRVQRAWQNLFDNSIIIYIDI